MRIEMNQNFFCASFLLGVVLMTYAEARVGFSSENYFDGVQEALRKANLVPEQTAVGQTGCSCINNDCGCCLDLNIPEIKLHADSCVNITYLPDEYGIRVTLTINKHTLINETVSAKNPPPICVAIPYLKDMVSACVDLYNLDVVNKTFSGCVKLEFHLVEVFKFSVNLGCFHIPLKDNKSVQHAKLMMEGLQRSRHQD